MPTDKQVLRKYIIEVYQGKYLPGLAGDMLKTHLQSVYTILVSSLEQTNKLKELKINIPEGYKREIRKVFEYYLDVTNPLNLELIKSSLERIYLKYFQDSDIKESTFGGKLIYGGKILAALLAISSMVFAAYRGLSKFSTEFKNSRDFIKTNSDLYLIYEKDVKPMLLSIFDDISDSKIKTISQLKYRFFEGIEEIVSNNPSLKGSLQTWSSSI